jgi:hypothetical protein
MVPIVYTRAFGGTIVLDGRRTEFRKVPFPVPASAEWYAVDFLNTLPENPDADEPLNLLALRAKFVWGEFDDKRFVRALKAYGTMATRSLVNRYRLLEPLGPLDFDDSLRWLVRLLLERLKPLSVRLTGVSMELQADDDGDEPFWRNVYEVSVVLPAETPASRREDAYLRELVAEAEVCAAVAICGPAEAASCAGAVLFGEWACLQTDP